jgi:simple sugar transport system permease protein
MNESLVVLSLVSAIVAAIPILFAALGEIIANRSGVMNLGIEGMMLVGGVVGFWAGNTTGSLVFAMVLGGLAGVVLAMIHAVLAVTLRVDQTVSGLSLVILGSGFSSFVGTSGEPGLLSAPNGVEVSSVFPETVRELPVLGPIVFGHDLMVYLGLAAVVLATYILNRTPTGLSLRAVGEDPASADSAGISVIKMRYIATAIGGFGAGVGGAYFVVAIVGTWQNGVTAGIGWIAVALVILAGWRPWLAFFGALAFGVLNGLGFTLQLAQVDVPSAFLKMMPFIAAYLVVVGVSASPKRARNGAAPAALAKPYSREAR